MVAKLQASPVASLSKKRKTFGNLLCLLVVMRTRPFSWHAILRTLSASLHSSPAPQTSRSCSCQALSICHRCSSRCQDKPQVSSCATLSSLLLRCHLRAKVSIKRCAAASRMSSSLVKLPASQICSPQQRLKPRTNITSERACKCREIAALAKTSERILVLHHWVINYAPVSRFHSLSLCI